MSNDELMIYKMLYRRTKAFKKFHKNFGIL